MAEEKLCGKCGAKPRAGKHAWCAECKAAYQREYVEGTEERAERRGFSRGCEAMQGELVAILKRMPPAGRLCVAEVARWISHVDRPEWRGAQDPKVT